MQAICHCICVMYLAGDRLAEQGCDVGAAVGAFDLDQAVVADQPVGELPAMVIRGCWMKPTSTTSTSATKAYSARACGSCRSRAPWRR